MTPRTEALTVAGPAGALQCALDRPEPAGHAPRGVAVFCHPHPLHGGTLDNKVVVTMARAAVQLGYAATRFNFRGVGRSEGRWDAGRGEIDDALAVVAASRALCAAGLPLLLGGFSFGGYVASQAAARLGGEVARLVLVSPAAQSFEVAQVAPHTLVVQGESDDVVPMGAVLDWARPQGLPVLVIPGGGHFFHGQLGLLKQILLDTLAPRVAS
jgi:alpha/beta superfamily hydrolase